MIKSTTEKTIKPSLKAFPITWFLLSSYTYLAFTYGDGFAIILISTYVLLPLALIMLLATYGRIYHLTDSSISKLNRITGKRETANFSSIMRTQIKPIAFGYGHIILTLTGGHKLKIKNIKLPQKSEMDYWV